MLVPAEQFTPEQLLRKRVAFRDDEEHAGCWHQQVGLAGGVVVRVGDSLTRKAELLSAEVELPEGWADQFDDVPRVWVKADPCESFPRGCEAAVELECLLVHEPE